MALTIQRRRLVLVSVLAMMLMPFLAGCGMQIPTDPNGTLDEVRGGTLRVGLSPNGDFVDVKATPYSGSEVDLIQDFASQLDAEVEWVVGGEESLVKELEEGDLDLVAGGISSKTPWIERVGLTRPYRTAVDGKGKEIKLVLLVPPGENAFLGKLEYFLEQTQEMP